MKRFEARVLLTVTTGRLLTSAKGERDNGIGDLYELLGWMTGDEPFTHQLPRFAVECKPFLLEWFPELATFDLEAFDEAAKDEGGIEHFILNWQASNRVWYDVPKIPDGSHTAIHPIAELASMTDKPIMVVELEGAESCP
jgi:hypothetical protein